MKLGRETKYKSILSLPVFYIKCKVYIKNADKINKESIFLLYHFDRQNV